MKRKGRKMKRRQASISTYQPITDRLRDEITHIVGNIKDYCDGLKSYHEEDDKKISSNNK